MARLVIHDLTTQYPRIDQMLANLPNAFFGAFNQAQDQQLKRELADLGKQKTQLELASLGQNMQSQAAADQAWQSMMGGATSAQPLSLGDLGGGYLSTLRSRESGGNDAARNPNSTATGRYQFTAGTWADLARKYPQLGLTPDGRTDPAQQERAIQAFTEDNRKALQAAGIAPSDANLYTAHFLGAGGARNFLSALQQDPTVLAADVVDPRAVAANRTMFFDGDRPLTVAEAASRIQRGFTGAAPRTQVAQADIPMAGGTPAQGFAIPQGAAPVQTGPTILPNLSTEQLQQLRGMRGLPKERQDLIDMALKERLDQGKPTDAMRGYLFARQQGYAGTFMDYQQELRRAGATNVNVGKGETKYDEEMGKQFAQLNKEIIDGAADGRRKVAVLSRMEGILSDPNVYTGAGANLVLQAKRMAKAMGFDVGDLSGPEAINAISNQFALELRNPSGGAGMPGALSDKDREFLQQSVPGLERTPGANKLIIDYMRRMAERSVQVDQLRRDYVRENKRLDEGFYDRLAEWSAANPLFTPADEAAVARAVGGDGSGEGGQGRPVTVRTEEDFRLLPSGTLFTAPDGTVRRKP